MTIEANEELRANFAVVLICLDNLPQHQKYMSKLMKAASEYMSADHSRRILKKLEKLGLVEAGEQIGRKRFLTLTPEGKSYIHKFTKLLGQEYQNFCKIQS